MQKRSRPLLADPLLTGPLLTGPLLARPLLTGPLLANPLLTRPLLTRPLLTGPLLTGPLLARPLLACFLLTCLPLGGCARHDKSQDEKQKDEIVYVKSEDPGMAAAIAKARQTLGDFKTALAAPPPHTERYAVKVGFPYGKDGREHIWMREPKLSETSVTGKIMNEPVDVTDLKFGQETTAPIQDISDWMYVENGVMRGGYTMRVLLDKMAPEEKTKMLGELGVKLE